MTLADVYECDKRAAEICTAMSVNGFGFDTQRGAAFAALLREEEARCLARVDAAVGRPVRRGKGGGLSTKDLHVAVFRELRAPVIEYTAKGKPSLGVNCMRAYAAAPRKAVQELALGVLEWRRARKVRVTYIENIQLGSDGRVHPSWHNYGAVSGRWACQGPNLMNLPRLANDPTAEVIVTPEGKRKRMGGIRTLYVPRPGCKIVGFDAKQLEMRVAAYASGDEAMISACESKDLHAANAALIFGPAFTAADADTRERLRNLSKNAGFAVCYLAEAETVYARLVADGVQVRLRAVEEMLRNLRGSFAGYFRWQEQRRYECMRRGWTDSPILGRRRWLGHDPSATECANFPIQSGAADLMNIRLPVICDALRAAHHDARILAQVHDAAYFEVQASQCDDVCAIIREVFEAPIVIGTSGRKLEVRFPLDMKVSERWS